MHQASGVPVERRPLATTPLPQNQLPNIVGPGGAHIPHTTDLFTSPDILHDVFDSEENEERPSLAEQAMTRQEQPKAQPQPALSSGIIRRNNGTNSLQRIQVRSNKTENKIVKSKKPKESIISRGFSSIRKVRDSITRLSEDGVDDELIELMHEHIQDEEEQEVPRSFSSLTESQEIAPIQQSGRHGLRRFD
jgi:hypothetical protein